MRLLHPQLLHPSLQRFLQIHNPARLPLLRRRPMHNNKRRLIPKLFPRLLLKQMFNLKHLHHLLHYQLLFLLLFVVLNF